MNKSFHNTAHYLQRKAKILKIYSKLTRRQKHILMLVGIDKRPVPSIEHLGAMLFLTERAMGIDDGPIRTPLMTYYPSGKPSNRM
jgi:hypothetical protein